MPETRMAKIAGHISVNAEILQVDQTAATTTIKIDYDPIYELHWSRITIFFA